MARDRQRAKQRKQRRLPQQSKREDGTRDEPVREDAAGVGERGNDDALVPQPRSIHRENVPGPFEHTGEVDEFEAALVAGADGEPEEDPDAAARAAFGDEDASAEDDVAAAPDREETHTAGAVSATRSSSDAPAAGRAGSRFANFLRASWAELQRVQWPDRRQVGQATAVVMGFVIVAGAFLGLADVVATKIVDAII